MECGTRLVEKTVCLPEKVAGDKTRVGRWFPRETLPGPQLLGPLSFAVCVLRTCVLYFWLWCFLGLYSPPAEGTLRIETDR